MGNSNQPKTASNSRKNSPEKNSHSPFSSNGKYTLTMKCNTWEKDSHGLFDYESKTLHKNQFNIVNSGRLIREKNEIKYTKEIMHKEQGSHFLFDVIQKNDNIFLESSVIEVPANPESFSETEGTTDNSVWIIVKALKNFSNSKGYNLQVGDFLRLGRMRFRLKTLLLPSSRKSPKKEDANFKKDASKFLSPQKQGENSKKDPLSKPSPLKEEVHNSQDSETNKILACRICLDSDSDEENPLVSPCKCAGTMGMIHVGCLQKWLKSKVVVKKNVISVCYQWKNLNCELCSSPFPESISFHSKKYDTLDFTYPSSSYLVLEILNKDKNTVRGLHIIDLTQKNLVKIGRGHEVDVRINDISVSRFHAVFRVEKGELFLDDNNSKFGTLVLMRKKLSLLAHTDYAVQVGRTVVSFHLKVKKNNCKNSCFNYSRKQNSNSKSKTMEFLEKKPEEGMEEEDDVGRREEEEDDEGGRREEELIDNAIFNQNANPLEIIDFNDEEEEDEGEHVERNEENVNVRQSVMVAMVSDSLHDRNHNMNN